MTSNKGLMDEKIEPRLFNVAGLVKRINAALPFGEIPFTITEPIVRQPLRYPFSDSFANLRDRLLEAVVKYSLRRTYGTLFGSETDVDVGHVLVEMGYTDLENHEETPYEALKLVLKVPLVMRNGSIISGSSHKLYAESGYGEIEPQRRSHKKVPFGWRRADHLSAILPDSWFFRTGTCLISR